MLSGVLCWQRSPRSWLCPEVMIRLLDLFLWGNARNVLQHGQNVGIGAMEVGPWDAGTANPAKVM